MNKLSQKMKECSKDKIHENNIINLNYKFDNLYKEFQNILSENKTLIAKLKVIKNENDIFTRIFTSEIQNFLNFLESQNFTTKIGLKMPLSTLPNFFGTNLDKSFLLKFDIMTKSISQLKEKIIEMINSILNKVNNVNEENLKLDEKNKNLINEHDTSKKDNQILKDKLNMVYQELYSIKNNYESLNNEHQNLKYDYDNMKTNLSNITKQNEKLSNEYNDFINAIQDKLLLSKVSIPSNIEAKSPKKSKSNKKNNINIFTQNITNNLLNKI